MYQFAHAGRQPLRLSTGLTPSAQPCPELEIAHFHSANWDSLLHTPHSARLAGAWGLSHGACVLGQSISGLCLVIDKEVTWRAGAEGPSALEWGRDTPGSGGEWAGSGLCLGPFSLADVKQQHSCSKQWD